MANVVKAALLQAKWTGDTASMIDVHEGYARTAAQQGAQIMGFQEVFNAPYFCQVQENEHYRWAEPVPDGPTVQRMQALARETGMVLVVPVFEVEDAGPLLQHRRGDRRRRHGARQVPQAPHPAGEGLLGEVLLPARQPGLAGVRHRGRPGRRLHLLRPALPRGLARAGAGGRADRLQPVGHQPGPVVVPVEARAARGRGGQRVLRRRDQPGGRGGVRRQRLLRHQLLRRPARPVRRRRRRAGTTRSSSSATSTST